MLTKQPSIHSIAFTDYYRAFVTLATLASGVTRHCTGLGALPSILIHRFTVSTELIFSSTTVCDNG